MYRLGVARKNWDYAFKFRSTGTNTATLLGLIGDLLCAVEELQTKVEELERYNENRSTN